jgi:hypothetical protein
MKDAKAAGAKAVKLELSKDTVRNLRVRSSVSAGELHTSYTAARSNGCPDGTVSGG